MYESHCNNMYLFCAPDKRNYDVNLLKRLIGFMNGYRWINYHVHKDPLLVIKKIDNLLRNPKPQPLTTIPIYIPYGKKGFMNSICGLMKGISMELASEIEKYYYPEITELEIHEIILSYYDDGKQHYKLANKIYITIHETWLRDR